MLTSAEIARSFRGVIALFMGKAEGLKLLDRSVDGFWRSFAVIVLLLPFSAVNVLAVIRLGGSGDNFSQLFFRQLPVLGLDWIAFPLAMAAAAKPLGVSANYVTFVVARNWAAPICAAVVTVPYLLQGAGWVPAEGAALLSLIAFLVVIWYDYVIIRLTLRAPVSITAGLVIADLLLSLLIFSLFQ